MSRWEFEPVEKRLDRLTMPIPECGCHMWLGTLSGDGYPRMTQIKPRNVARYIYEREKGKIPEGLQIDHLCKTTWCINPDHLEAVTPSENLRRRTFGKLCKNGHIRVEISPGRYWCVECRRKTARDYHYRHREKILVYSREYDRTKRKR